MEISNSDILIVDEAAKLLKIPSSSAYKLAQNGKHPTKKIDRIGTFTG